MKQAVFGLVAGPLTWSIVALRNSLVLHSLDQVPTQPSMRQTLLRLCSTPKLVVWPPDDQLTNTD